MNRKQNCTIKRKKTAVSQMNKNETKRNNLRHYVQVEKTGLMKFEKNIVERMVFFIKKYGNAAKPVV